MGNAAEWAAKVRGALGARRVNKKPAVGAIAWWDGAGPFGFGGYGHVAYVEKFSKDVVYLSDSRWDSGSQRWTVRPGSGNWPDRFLHIKDAPTDEGNPMGRLERAVAGGRGKVVVNGWAFDPNARKTPVSIHVYVGGQAGEAGAVGVNAGKAKGRRNDVGRVHRGVGNFHGFSFTIATSKAGPQKVCVYAINIGRGTNVLLRCKTVNIPANYSGPTWTQTIVPWSAGSGPDLQPITGDWDGDGKTDIGLRRISNGNFYLKTGPTWTQLIVPWSAGSGPDLQPITGDWDGDGKTDIGLRRISNGNFYFRTQS